MKYKIIQNIPGHYVGQIVTTNDKGEFNYYKCGDYSDFFEEVKGPKTIYDLKRGDEIWVINGSDVIKNKAFAFSPNAHISVFLTEREAKRNKILRELATRTDKWLPSRGEPYITYTIDKPTYTYTIDWVGSNCDIVLYHMGLVFRGEKEYNKWITEEAKYLLFNI